MFELNQAYLNRIFIVFQCCFYVPRVTRMFCGWFIAIWKWAFWNVLVGLRWISWRYCSNTLFQFSLVVFPWNIPVFRLKAFQVSSSWEASWILSKLSLSFNRLNPCDCSINSWRILKSVDDFLRAPSSKLTTILFQIANQPKKWGF